MSITLEQASRSLEKVERAAEEVIDNAMKVIGDRDKTISLLKQQVNKLEQKDESTGRMIIKLHQANEQLEQQLQNEWVSVETKLPEEHEDIMVIVGRGVTNGQSVPFQSETSFYNGVFEIEELDFISSPVTHWRPLLPSPSGE